MTERGALTNWRRQRERQVRTEKDSDRARDIHLLETAEGGASHGTERSDRARSTHQLETAEEATSQDTKKATE
jgi:hypothetical protein